LHSLVVIFIYVSFQRNNNQGRIINYVNVCTDSSNTEITR
jgi:hypothetical protein